ncbi:hypothetical protein GQ44DRAFT_614125 [Phaeosphaeriaceae sp. PMI808]|nr:hypothetical protein GQ44DRAFT_614125 [Phaeosphaeriaceae sp. PMI808]
MRDLTTITTAYVLLFAHQVSATVGVLNIADLLEPNLEDPLSASQEIAQPYAPWTHKPHCAVSTSLASLGQKYCVYTSNITGPYGLSLISTPAHARLATEHLNDIPLSSFFTPAEASTLYSNPSPWKIVNIRGKDKGVIATRKIAKYETFMIDQAAVVVDLSFSDAMTQTEESAMLKVAVDRLLVPGLIRDMSSSHAESGEGSLESDIMMTNSFGSTVAGVSTKTLFPIISVRLHYRSWRLKRIEILKKERRSLYHVNLLLGLPSKRRAQVLKRWGFTCSCSLCSLPPREREASDMRRVMIEQAEKKIAALSETYQIDEAIALAHESVGLIIDEDLPSMMTDEFVTFAFTLV